MNLKKKYKSKDIKQIPITNSLELIRNVQPITYNYIDIIQNSNHTRYGLDRKSVV